MVNQQSDALYFFPITAQLFSSPGKTFIGLTGLLVYYNLLFIDSSCPCPSLSAILVKEFMHNNAGIIEVVINKIKSSVYEMSHKNYRVVNTKKR